MTNMAESIQREFVKKAIRKNDKIDKIVTSFGGCFFFFFFSGSFFVSSPLVSLHHVADVNHTAHPPFPFCFFLLPLITPPLPASISGLNGDSANLDARKRVRKVASPLGGPQPADRVLDLTITECTRHSRPLDDLGYNIGSRQL